MGTCHTKNQDRGAEDIVTQKSRKSAVIGSKESFVFDLVSENMNPIQKEYRIDPAIIGKGAFGEVRKASNIASGEVRAIKIIYKQNCSKSEQERIFNEITIMKTLDHPNIVRIYEYFQDQKYIFIVMELVQGKELFDKIVEAHHFNERMAANIMHQLLSAVNYLHKHSIVHRDLKPENIIFDGVNIKLIDFGTSQLFTKNHKMKTIEGTPYYIAPEVLDQAYNEKCDEWSCGVILYIMLSGSPPFNGRNDREIMAAVQKGKYDFNRPEFDDVSNSAKSIINKLLTFAIKNRISAEQALEHEWFKNVHEKTDALLNSGIMSNLQKFQIHTKMQQAVYYFIITNLTSKEETRELNDIFKALDTNNDGIISKEELTAGVKKINQFLSEEEIELLMNKIDNKKNKGIEYSEFVAAAIDRAKVLSEEKISKCFKQLDKDSSGKITVAEFKQVFQGNNIVQEEVWKALVHEIDLNQDGEIEYEEFKKMLLQLC